MASQKKFLPALSVTGAAIVSVVLIVVCCAGPALFISGALGFLGGILKNVWLIAAGVAVLLVAITYAIRQQINRSRL